jgi:ketosteroid isomerase-like protein
LATASTIRASGEYLEVDLPQKLAMTWQWQTHDDRFLMNDFVNTVRGLDDYNRTWNFFYANPKGPITYRPRDMIVTAGHSTTFATCAVHCDGTSAGPLDIRLTVGLRKQDKEWLIVHEHHSVPMVEMRFIGPKEV